MAEPGNEAGRCRQSAIIDRTAGGAVLQRQWIAWRGEEEAGWESIVERGEKSWRMFVAGWPSEGLANHVFSLDHVTLHLKLSLHLLGRNTVLALHLPYGSPSSCRPAVCGQGQAKAITTGQPGTRPNTKRRAAGCARALQLHDP